MYHTTVRPVRDLRNNYPELAESVRNNDHVIITNNGKSEAVLISFEQFKKYEEFIHMQYVAQKLDEAEARANDADAVWLSDKEFWMVRGLS